ncbi:MAG: TIGR04086 family membrane protein [Clostridia bacterium]|nr:TIGR04086 family membrane protein [Clostridia bacterium]
MKMKGKLHEDVAKRSSLYGNVLKGSVVALCCSLLLVLVFAFLLKFTNIPDSVISPINQVIKGISVFVGVFVGLKKSKELGLVSGLLIGFIYTTLAFFVFSLLAGSFCLDITLLVDMIFGGVIGAVCGIICINLKKSSN